MQRRATKQHPGMKDLPYPERIKLLKCPTLVYRRARGDMIETSKLLHDKYYGEYSQLVKLHASHISREGTRGHRFKLCQEGSKLNIRRHSFPVRITKVWNELPDSVVNAPNVNTLKTGWTDTGGEKTSYTTTKHPYQDTTWQRTGLSDSNTLI